MSDEPYTLRDWFAGMGLRGAADAICDDLDSTYESPEHGGRSEAERENRASEHAKRHARAAYMLADAMLAARNEK